MKTVIFAARVGNSDIFEEMVKKSGPAKEKMIPEDSKNNKIIF